MNVEASITGKRQITIPKDLYNEMHLKNTDKLVFSKNENGEIIVSKKEINVLDVCPICEREVLKEDVMVVKESQKYHEVCWSNSKNKDTFKKTNHFKYIANKLSPSQVERLHQVGDALREYTFDLIKSIEDNEVVIDVPVKIRFSENQKSIIAMVAEFNSNIIFNCNSLVECDDASKNSVVKDSEIFDIYEDKIKDLDFNIEDLDIF